MKRTARDKLSKLRLLTASGVDTRVQHKERERVREFESSRESRKTNTPQGESDGHSLHTHTAGKTNGEEQTRSRSEESTYRRPELQPRQNPTLCTHPTASNF
jgi:hypothetical protein